LKRDLRKETNLTTIKQLVDQLELNPAVSVIDGTKLKAYMGCPRRFFYEHILGWRGIKSNHLVFGSAVHEAIEHLLLNGYDAPNVLAAYEKFLRCYRKSFSAETDPVYWPKTPENFFAGLSLYAKRYARDLENYEVIATEIAGSTLVADFELHFRMDSIVKNRKTDAIGSLEHKTASSENLWQDQFYLSIQVGTYSHVLNCCYPDANIEGITINGLFFMKAKKGWEELLAGKPVSVKGLPFDLQRPVYRRTEKQMNIWLTNTLMVFEDLLRDFESLALIPADDPNAMMSAFPLRETNCSSFNRLCEYHNFCNAWTNPWARRYDVPTNFDFEIWNPMAQPAKHILEAK